MNKLFIILIFYSTTVFSSEYFKFNYRIKDHDSFSKILKHFHKKGIKLSIKERGTRETIFQNPHIKDWKRLPTGEIITIFVNEKKANEKNIKLLALENKKQEENGKTFFEVKAEKNIEERESKHIFRAYYTNSSIEGKESEPSTIETPIKSFLGGGLEYFYYFNRTIYPLILTSKFKYQTYRKISILAATNPSRVNEEVSIPAATTLNLTITKEKVWNQLSPFASLERDSMYNLEFNTSLDRNTLRKTTFIWGGGGTKYSLPLKNMDIKLGVSFWTSLTTETELSDPIGGIEFSESISELDISANKTKLTLEGVYKKYFLILGLVNTSISGDKTLEYAEVFSKIGLYF